MITENQPITGYSSTTAVTPPTLWDEVSALQCASTCRFRNSTRFDLRPLWRVDASCIFMDGRQTTDD